MMRARWLMMHGIAVLLVGAGRGRPCQEPYFDFCVAQLQIGVDVEAELVALGFDCVGCGGSLGGSDLALRRSRKTLFRARETVLEHVSASGWRIGWPGDSLVIQGQWKQLGHDPGPWCRIATVEHRVTSTERVLAYLERDGFSTYFLFGSKSDLVFARTEVTEKAARALKRAAFRGVEVFGD